MRGRRSWQPGYSAAWLHVTKSYVITLLFLLFFPFFPLHPNPTSTDPSSASCNSFLTLSARLGPCISTTTICSVPISKPSLALPGTWQHSSSSQARVGWFSGKHEILPPFFNFLFGLHPNPTSSLNRLYNMHQLSYPRLAHILLTFLNPPLNPTTVALASLALKPPHALPTSLLQTERSSWISEVWPCTSFSESSAQSSD